MINDGDGNQHDVRNCLQFYDVHEEYKSDQQKEEAIKMLKKNLNIITSKTTTTKQKLHVCVKLRLFAPTYNYVLHRGNDVIHNKDEKLLRKQLFDKDKWTALQGRIDYEQNKKNRKKDRKMQKYK